jgi:16S rRNA (guanine1207-N2)-methyltransferase
VRAAARPLDPYFKKSLTLRLERRAVRLDVAHDLFSGHHVDTGTRLLLRTLATPEHEQRRKVVDLGCGYGPLGLGLKSLVPSRSVEMVDRDALALEYSTRNAELNGMAGVHASASLGWTDVEGTGFDLAVSNIPAKAGERAIRHFLLGAREHLAAGGIVAVVGIGRLDGLIRQVLDQAAGVEVRFSRRSAGYSVYHYGFLPEQREMGQPAVTDPLAVFQRGEVRLSADLDSRIRTAYSLPEFDNQSYQTRLMVELLLDTRPPARHVLVFNPGQGYLPVLAWKRLAPERLTLAGRDLLALRYSRANLVDNAFPEPGVRLLHRVTLEQKEVEGVDLALVALKDGHPPRVTEFEVRSILEGLRPPCRVHVGGTSTAITRLESTLKREGPVGLRIAGRRRSRGFSVLELAA